MILHNTENTPPCYLGSVKYKIAFPSFRLNIPVPHREQLAHLGLPVLGPDIIRIRVIDNLLIIVNDQCLLVAVAVDPLKHTPQNIAVHIHDHAADLFPRRRIIDLFHNGKQLLHLTGADVGIHVIARKDHGVFPAYLHILKPCSPRKIIILYQT